MSNIPKKCKLFHKWVVDEGPSETRICSKCGQTQAHYTGLGEFGLEPKAYWCDCSYDEYLKWKARNQIELEELARERIATITKEGNDRKKALESLRGSAP